jgi:hypothetical protein
VEALLFAFFTAWASSAQRFLTFWAVAAAPYLARSVSEWLAARRGGRPAPSPALRTAGAVLACFALTAAEIVRAGFPLGVAIHPTSVPVAACDFIAAHGVRGRSFNYFEHGGYLLWRFWPEKDRLPFMTTSPELATPEIRLEYQRAFVLGGDWRRMDERHRFDWVLLRRQTQPGDQLVDFVDADSAFALVFLDDVAALFVRRTGRMAALARREGFHWLPAGQAKLDTVAARIGGDPAARAEMRKELRRAIAASPRNAGTAMTLAALDIAERRWDEAEWALEESRRADPQVAWYRERKAAIAAGRASMRP